MSTNNVSSSSSSGVGFSGLLTLLFIALKLTHVIDWPWIWVLSPLWIGFAVFVAFALIFLVLYLIFGDK